MAELCQGPSEVVAREWDAYRARISWSATAARPCPFPRPVRMGLAYKAAVAAARAKSPSRPPGGAVQIEPRTTYQPISPSKMLAAINVAAAATFG
jgi:hypothetical protein